MSDKKITNCVIDCRISSTKQQTGGSLADQERVCRNFTERMGWNVLRVFSKVYSGRDEERADFEDILAYIKKTQEKGISVDYYVPKSIDRMTRDGTVTFEEMKGRLTHMGVQLADAYGVIQPEQNTLAHLGFEFDWSKRSPTATAQIMEAQRAKDEVTDILTRMIGAEIQLVKEGYKVRPPTDGFINEHIMVDGKKKVIESPDPKRAMYFIEIFKLRSLENSDSEIVSRINAMGYRSKLRNIWNKDHSKVVGRRGGIPLTIKQLQKIIQKPIYAGYKCEKWTNNLLLKAKYNGLVPVELFNKANRGKVYIQENSDGSAELLTNFDPNRTKRRLKNNPLFPYKFIRCHCGKPHLGSSPTGKSGNKFPTYHCARKHSFVGIPKKEFEENIEKYVKSLKFNPDYINSLEITFLNKFREREKEIVQSSATIHLSISELKAEQATKIQAIVNTNSDIVRKKLEQEVEELETKIKEARRESLKVQINENDIKAFIKEAKKVMEHPSELLLDSVNINSKEALFGLVFEEIPTYHQIISRTPKLHWIFNASLDSIDTQTHAVSPLYLEWNTFENMVLKWNQVFSSLDLNTMHA